MKFGRNRAGVGENAIAVLRLYNEISMDNAMVQDALTVLPQHDCSGYRALVVILNTSGGTLSTAQHVLAWIERLFVRQGRPFVAVIEERCLSAGLYVAAHADRVYAQPAALMGSFGAMMEWPRSQVFRDRLGLSSRIFKSAPHKDLLSPKRAPEADDEARIQELLDDLHEQFARVLRDRRAISVENLRLICDGRFVTGEAARRLGLVDELGGLDRALDYLVAGQHITNAMPDFTYIGDMTPQSRGGAGDLLQAFKSLLEMA